MYVEITAFFLGVSILFYCLFAGADFGAGILEVFLGKRLVSEQRELISHAIAPVWEANHVWLVLAVVILFNGFPRAYAEFSTVLHIPLTLLLIGVIMRGCAFTFRHYDASPSEQSQKLYSGIFMLASCLTPFMLGMIAGSTLLGHFSSVQFGFYEVYMRPWFNLFCASVGLFTCALFTFLASVYLIGETGDRKLKDLFVRRARIANICVVVSGAFVFLCAEWDHFSLLSLFFKADLSLVCMGLATLLLLPLWMSLGFKNVWPARVFGAAQMSLVLGGFIALQYPTLLGTYTLINSAAPDVVLKYLLFALVGGVALIFPALFGLFWTFKRNPKERLAGLPS